MADVITFSCTRCQLPFRVASSNAGRAFQCKNCGTQLVVPQASQPMEPVIVPQEPEVQLGAGQQVIRKTDSARRASVDPTRMITRNSGAHPAVVPPAGPGFAPAPARKGNMPLLVGLGTLGLVSIVLAILFLGGVLGGSGGASPAPELQPAAQANTAPAPRQLSEREQILNVLTAPDRTGPRLIELYQRAVASRLDKPDQASVAREAVVRIESESGQGLSDDAILDFGETLSAGGYRNECQRLFGMIARRYQGKPDAPAAYARAQKLRNLEQADFAPLLARADQLVQAGVTDGAKALHEELQQLSQAAVDGWVDHAAALRAVQIDQELKTQEEEVERLRRDDPFRFVAARAVHLFRSQKVATRNQWGVHIQEPVIVYYAVRKDESEETARYRNLEAIHAAAQFVSFYRREFVEPMKLSRSLPTELADADLRNQAPVEVLLFETLAQWRAYLSDVRARIDTNRETHLTEQASGRFSFVYDGSTRALAGLVTQLTRHCIETWHPRARETRDKAAFQTFVLESPIAAVISLTQRKPGGDDPEFDFFATDERVVRQLAGWRGPFKSEDTAISAFGGPAVTLRDLVTMRNAGDFIDAFERNIRKHKGWKEEQIKGVVDSMRSPNSELLSTVAVPYLRAFHVFLWHHARNGKPRYRDAYRRFLLLDLQGKVTETNQLEQFNAAFGLNDAGWKELEAEFLAFQTEP